MYEDNQKQFQNQIIPKKAIKINDDDNNKKKYNKKNKRKQHAEQPQYTLPKEQPMGNNNKRRDEEEEALKDLCCILSNYKSATIRRVLVENAYNKTEAMNQLLNIPPDNEEEWGEGWGEGVGVGMGEKRPSQERSSSTNNSEMANNLINQMYDTMLKEEEMEDINGREFEELFEEIAELIKEDQRDRGVGMFEINNFVDECNSVKQTLLVGFREELSNFDDFEFDESYPLYAQTQLFLEGAIKKEAKEQKQLMEDFPVLGRQGKGGKNQEQGNQQRNIVERIRLQQKRRKEEALVFFAPSKGIPQYAKERNNEASIFNVDNKLHSQRDLVSLHKQFADVPIRDLKFVYKTFVGDFNMCRNFLLKNYADKRSQPQESARLNPIPRQPQRIHTSRLRKEQVDQQLQHLSLKDVREQIDHLFKLRQALQITKMKIKSNSQKVELDRMINEKMPLIRKLAQASRVKQVEMMRKNNPLYVDLHGYREEEVATLLDSISQMITQEYGRNGKVVVKKVKGRLCACLVAMTGKGLHSRGNKSVLKPATIDWCISKNYDFEQEEDHMRTFIPLA